MPSFPSFRKKGSPKKGLLSPRKLLMRFSSKGGRNINNENINDVNVISGVAPANGDTANDIMVDDNSTAGDVYDNAGVPPDVPEAGEAPSVAGSPISAAGSPVSVAGSAVTSRARSRTLSPVRSSPAAAALEPFLPHQIQNSRFGRWIFVRGR